MLIETLSVFPEMFEPVMSTSILGRARKAGLFDFKAYNLRDWTHDRHRTVDDEPYGGGQGMLMKVEPIAEAIEAISAEGPKPTVVFFTPCGEPFTQHTINDVPFTLVSEPYKNACLHRGILADISPTILALAGLPQPASMTGHCLIKK